MTMYILAGGCDRLYPDYGKHLAELILREKSTPTILSCMFSQEVGDRQQRYEYFDEWFKTYFGDRVSILHANDEEFFEQLRHSDVLYLHGGTTKHLLGALPNIEKFKLAVQGKIVVGSSAGANYLSKIYYSVGTDKVINGTGVLEIGVLVHYGIEKFDERVYKYGDWGAAVAKVKTEAKNIPTVLLPEGSFIVIDA